MINKRKVVAVIPARGGSKGIPGKNLYEINGKPLVQLAVELAQSHSAVDEVYITTDCEEIYSLSQQLGVSTPELRPSHLSRDNSTTVDVVKYLVENGLLEQDDVLLLLQPPSPLRKLKHLNDIIELFTSEKVNAVVSVCEVSEPHPYKVQVIKNG